VIGSRRLSRRAWRRKQGRKRGLKGLGSVDLQAREGRMVMMRKLWRVGIAGEEDWIRRMCSGYSKIWGRRIGRGRVCGGTMRKGWKDGGLGAEMEIEDDTGINMLMERTTGEDIGRGQDRGRGYGMDGEGREVETVDRESTHTTGKRGVNAMEGANRQT